MTLIDSVRARLKDAVGAKGFSEDADEIAPHLVEWRSKYQGQTSLLLKPRTTEEVSAVLAICNETATPTVPQGGNTGLVGGQIPFHGEVLLSLSRLDRVRRVDGTDMSMVAEAGVVLAKVHEAALEADCFFPLSIASEGSATIGGNLSTNAGGVNVLRYGSTRALVLGIEVVLADGRVLDLLRTLHKDNTGYDLKQLFIGAEGTLGVITAAALRLFPKPTTSETAFLAVRDPEAAVALLHRLQNATGGLVSAFELIARQGLQFVLDHIPNASDPLAKPSSWYVLTEVAAAGELPIKDLVEKSIQSAIEDGVVTDGVVASNETQRKALWHLRESMSEAQKFEGGSIKHDVSVPIDKVPAFLKQGIALVEKLVPGVRPVPFGHIGDGNIHFNFSVPKGGDNKAFLARWDEVSHAVHDLVRDFHGSISAEHGLGVMKRDEILRYKSQTEMDVMRALKKTLDPKNILNPGKVV
ncbi:MAG TPA: FAD-binding oxidoreductase [Rhizomicrobium sp.]|nr:FAD-binding oxidoreductase [Rhizomicrobium sp.]